MKREDFVFTIGFQGDSAVIDGPARRKYGTLGFAELLEQGLYRPAFCAAVYDGEIEAFKQKFTALTGESPENETALKRLFGVFDIPDTVEKSIVVG
mgnify:CR=1 FL=1